MITFDKIVYKLCKKEWKILSIYEIWGIIDPDFKKWTTKNISLIYKTIYRLKATKIIIPIKNSLYFINNKKDYRDVDIIDNFYWDILKKVIIENIWNNYFVWNLKALELHLKDFSIPSEITIYCKDFESTISLTSQNKIIFKILTWWKKNLNKSIFAKLNVFTKKILINKISFKIANEELSLLDSLLIRNSTKKIDSYLINKFLNKFSRFLSRQVLWKLVDLKYITSINRLREISKETWNNQLYLHCLDIIKIEWWNCFLTSKK